MIPPTSTTPACRRDSTEITQLVEDLRYPRFQNLEKCAVMTTGINELIETKNPNVDTSSMKPDHQGMERQRAAVVAKMDRKKELAKLKTELEELGVSGGRTDFPKGPARAIPISFQMKKL